MTRFNYGGQAVIEGVMMRGEHDWAVAVRDPAGKIAIRREPLGVVYRNRVMKWPFVRGLTMLWDALGLGMRALMWSADIAVGEEEDVSLSGPVGWGTVALSLVLGIGLFFLLPMFLVSLLDHVLPSGLASNLAEGLLRLLFFIAYLWAIGFVPDIRRVFAYHGAEHKTINAYEQGAALDPASVARYSRAHTRCGTAFLLIVVVIYVIIATFLGRPALVLRLASRIVLIPVVAGIAYEVLKLTAKHYERSQLVRILIAPSLALQRLTTREPDLPMLEVSIAALKQVLAAEGLAEETSSEGALAEGLSPEASLSEDPPEKELSAEPAVADDSPPSVLLSNT